MDSDASDDDDNDEDEDDTSEDVAAGPFGEISNHLKRGLPNIYLYRAAFPSHSLVQRAVTHTRTHAHSHIYIHTHIYFLAASLDPNHGLAILVLGRCCCSHRG